MLLRKGEKNDISAEFRYISIMWCVVEERISEDTQNIAQGLLFYSTKIPLTWTGVLF